MVGENAVTVRLRQQVLQSLKVEIAAAADEAAVKRKQAAQKRELLAFERGARALGEAGDQGFLVGRAGISRSNSTRGRSDDGRGEVNEQDTTGGVEVLAVEGNRAGALAIPTETRFVGDAALVALSAANAGGGSRAGGGAFD